ncbi:gamma-mobile-trio recombinase GmtY [Sulfuritalea hydrogenivorans]|uniref:Integrase family protein n=1 Tax=Sulfuritalea hydrogenivorans sk43H TaxID=1223802 RepID=W0SJ63_9PROT|nr:gamma-mobile-trio recombinase GmtY [Sulfuritalea hydrogenivorans]BAO30038.1 integrase family protein [Sulfuritalea hydrogenivorans sk43H]
MPFATVNAKIVSDNTGASMQIPVLMTAEGPLRSLIDYCLSMRRSQSWQNKLLRAVKLFLEYLEVNAMPGEEEWRFFRNFANALKLGTIDRNTFEDSSGLYWAPFEGQDANYMITQLSEFFDWLARGEGPRAAKFNPVYKGGVYDQRIDLHAYHYRRSKAFLGHVWSDNPSGRRSRVTRGERLPKVFPKRPPMFPEDRFEELLFKGFRVSGQCDYRGMLITLLLFGGGLRVSEPFHLYMADVQPYWDDPLIAFVAVHHPSLGVAPNHWENLSGQRGTRAEYLASEFGMTPRNLIRGRMHAGWKDPALDERWFMNVHWFPRELYGRWFMQIWSRYLEQVASIERHHPFAFINLDRASVGGVYCIGSYLKALQSAVERIGLVYGKAHGTTAHGSRHAYAQRARRGGIDPVIIQRIMHHCSPMSQKVYTQPELHEAATALQAGARKLAEENSEGPSNTGLIGRTADLRLGSIWE